MVEVDHHNKPKFKIYGALSTIIIHALLIATLLILGFTTPIPPYPEGGGGPGMGIEVNMGNSDEGFGTIQDQTLSVPEKKEENKNQTETENKNKFVTQDVETTPDINVSDKTDKKKKEKKEKKDNSKDKVVKEDNKDNSKIYANAAPKINYPTYHNPSHECNTGNSGDQGNPNGDPNSKNYKGDGGNGSGGGKGGGNGTGTGTGNGSGISYNLEGRGFSFLPSPQTISNEHGGKVVVEVTVDRNGNVTAAIPGVKGSTTLDEDLLMEAKKAAMLARFERKSDAPEFQKGTITYTFIH